MGDFAVGHENCAIAHMRDDARIMGDRDERRARRVFRIVEQIENSRLYRDVERRGRLVQQRYARRDRDELALAPEI
ncbi:hypothetical protein PY650_18270 [Rhizobium calliandrae]|uniref:Uncharacterized protein n=1 Tax=Rhizobium calliandrae TaxID=1312182 RepID=A0ABT7KGN5_9HYPH|nr:hypothetical protein [Rhizobium calliandrae]MDL2407576.1 hypothetical protein [Rhizobium calliandrae]